MKKVLKKKSCLRCFQVRPATTKFFSPARTTKDGLYGQCRPCRASIERLRYYAKKKAQNQSSLSKLINKIINKLIKKK